MIRQLMHNALKAKRRGKNIAEKIGIFRDLAALEYKTGPPNKLNNSERTMHLSGYKITANDNAALSIMYNEIFLSDDYYFETSNPSPLIIDCGSNIGFSVLYFKKLYPLSRLIAFEPNPNTFKLLEKNISQNAIQEVTLYNTALSICLLNVKFAFTCFQYFLLACTCFPCLRLSLLATAFPTYHCLLLHFQLAPAAQRWGAGWAMLLTIIFAG